MKGVAIRGDSTNYVIIFCEHKSFGTQNALLLKIQLLPLHKVIAVHVLVIFSEKIGFGLQ